MYMHVFLKGEMSAEECKLYLYFRYKTLHTQPISFSNIAFERGGFLENNCLVQQMGKN
jgi:hypothetical protein